MSKKKTESSLEMWAADLLMEAHAIEPCREHGYKRLRHSHQAIDYALSLAEHRKFSGRNKKERIAAVVSVSTALAMNVPLAEAVAVVNISSRYLEPLSPRHAARSGFP